MLNFDLSGRRKMLLRTFLSRKVLELSKELPEKGDKSSHIALLKR